MGGGKSESERDFHVHVWRKDILHLGHVSYQISFHLSRLFSVQYSLTGPNRDLKQYSFYFHDMLRVFWLWNKMSVCMFESHYRIDCSCSITSLNCRCLVQLCKSFHITLMRISTCMQYVSCRLSMSFKYVVNFRIQEGLLLFCLDIHILYCVYVCFMFTNVNTCKLIRGMIHNKFISLTQVVRGQVY